MCSRGQHDGVSFQHETVARDAVGLADDDVDDAGGGTYR